MRILLLILALVGAFPATPATPEPKKKTASSATTASDSQIEKDIRARLARSKLSANNIQVAVKNGVATLDGQVKVVQHKGIATRMARSAGAKQVVNRIKIDDAARQKAANQLSHSRAAKVKRTP
ncbi:MAG: BON domain-containing protein [Acidobacteria bacterium]|nr:BON domain-containing protein [Acidobacteriota bacterium]